MVPITRAYRAFIRPYPSRWFQLLLFGRAKIGSIQEEEWSEPRTRYAFLCWRHGVVTDRVRGSGNKLVCPKCQEKEADG